MQDAYVHLEAFRIDGAIAPCAVDQADCSPDVAMGVPSANSWDSLESCSWLCISVLSRGPGRCSSISLEALG